MQFLAWMLVCVPLPQFPAWAPSPQFAAYTPVPHFEQSGTPADAIATAGQPIGATAVSHPPTPPAPAASVVAYVWGAKWCTWCKVMSPAVRQLREEGWPIYEYDVDEHQNMAAAWEAYTLPTVIALRIEDGEGVALERVQAYQTYEQLRAMLVRNGVKQDTSKQPVSSPIAQGRAVGLTGGCSGGSCPTFRRRSR